MLKSSQNFSNLIRAKFLWLEIIFNFFYLLIFICTLYTEGLQRLAGIHDPPEQCDIPIKAEFEGDYHGGSGETGNG